MSNIQVAITAELLSQLVEAAPKRIQRKLDKAPDVARQWDWQFHGGEHQVDTGKEQVTLRPNNGRLSNREQVHCSCLLGPKCLHVLAVVSLLSLAEADTDETPDELSKSEEAEGSERAPLEAAQHDAAEMMWEVVGQLLGVGARAAGVALQTQLARSIHSCRAEGLFRLSANGQHLLKSIRQLRSDDDQFQAAALRDSFYLTSSLAWRLRSQSSADPALMGQGRRRYEEVSGLKFDALLCEPVLTQTGYAGIVSYFVDAGGQLSTISRVRPGDLGDLPNAWNAALDVGGISNSHRSTAGHCLLMQKGSRSEDGRLGAGQDTRAVLMEGRGWGADGIAGRFQRTVAEQATQVFDQWASIGEANDDLVFLRGRMLGLDDLGARLVTGDGEQIQLLPAHESDELPYKENLRQLAHAPGLQCAAVGRLSLRAPGGIELLCVSADGGDVRLVLPAEWGGRVDLGWRRLSRSHFSASVSTPPWFPDAEVAADDGLDRLRARLLALAIGGRSSLTPRSINGLAREAGQLEQQLQPTGAALLSHLASLAEATQVGIDGLRFVGEPSALGEAWLAAASYESAARYSFQKASWMDGLGLGSDTEAADSGG